MSLQLVRSRLLLVAAAAVLLATGCSSTSTSSDETAPPGQPAVGVTDDTITIGVRYLENGDKLNQQIGANIKEGDQKAFVEAIVDDINENGGVAGRDLEVVLDARDALSQEPYDQQDQASCAVFTQDNEVLAVAHIMSADAKYVGCLNDRGVPLVTAETTGMSQETFDDYPGYAAVVGMRLDRIAALEPQVLADADYFTGWDAAAGAPGDEPVEFGIVTQDTPPYNYALDHDLLPALAEVGVEPDQGHVLRLKVPESEAEVEAAVAEMQNGILKMQQDGVTHIMVFEQNGSMTQFFTQMAAEQSYRPRLAVNTGSAAQVGLQLGYLAKAQMAGAVGMGWAPMSDLPQADIGEGSPYRNDEQTHCLDLMRERGLDVAGTAGTNAIAFCDVLYFLRDALDDEEDFTTDTVVDAIEGYGDQFVSGSVGPTQFGPDQHDGVAEVHTYLYDDSCGCMQYEGDPISAE